MSKPLTRDEMAAVILAGGSVIFQERLISKLEHLPTEADLAVGDPEKEAVAAFDLRAQIAAMQAQLDKLSPPVPASTETIGDDDLKTDLTGQTPGFQTVADDAAALASTKGK